MPDPKLDNSLRKHRERLGLSQQALGERVGVTRQAILAIEAGRQVPSTSLTLQLARVLGCTVESLFQLTSPADLRARLAPAARDLDPVSECGSRVVLGDVEGQWVAHRLAPDAALGADGLLRAGAAGPDAVVRPLAEAAQLRRNVLVAGCAPLLGALAQRVGARFSDARVTWLHAGSRRALTLLEARLVHVAGLHVSEAHTGEDNASQVRRMFPGQRMLVVNLTRWRQGFVVAAGNPMTIRGGADLLRPGLRLARREEGAGAQKLMTHMLLDQGARADLPSGPFARGHADVARLVGCGAADVGVAIESVALAAGLDFVPLADERFDLVVPATLAAVAPVSRLLQALDSPAFRTEMAHLPGYDTDLSGQVTTVDAA